MRKDLEKRATQGKKRPSPIEINEVIKGGDGQRPMSMDMMSWDKDIQTDNGISQLGNL